MLNFLERLSNIALQFNRILGTRFVPGHWSMETPLGSSLTGIFTFHNAGRYADRDFELLKLELFLKHLLEIEAADRDLLHIYKKEIKRAGSTDSFYGIRFEVNIAASLLRKNISFHKQESPDFRIDVAKVSIECGSVRMRGGRPKDGYIYKKIGQCLREKEKKGYQTFDTALFIDITNALFSEGILLNVLPNKEEIRQATLKLFSSNSFGNATLFHYLYDVQKNTLISAYIRCDHPKIRHRLKNFLDSFYPFGDGYIHHFRFPAEG